MPATASSSKRLAAADLGRPNDLRCMVIPPTRPAFALARCGAVDLPSRGRSRRDLVLHAYLPLIGVGVVVLGFVAGINPLIVVIAAALASGIAGGLDAHSVIAAFGKAFNDNRFVSL